VTTALSENAISKPTPRLAELFTVFFHAGLIGFGGVMPIARRLIVEEKKWLDNAAFTDLLGPSQFLPGAMVVNLAIAVGTRFGGTMGAIVAVLGLLSAPTIIVLALAALYGRIHDNPQVEGLLAGLAAAATGLFIATALKMARPLHGKRVGIFIAAATFAAMALLKLPLFATILIMTPISMILQRRFGP